MIKLVLIFIVIYVSFMAVAVNYAKAFRVKNQLINYVEQTQYRYGDSTDNIENYLAKVPYNVTDSNNGLKQACDADAENTTEKSVFVHGACIAPRCDKDSGSCYYRITTYISVDFPFFNIHMTLPVRGETKTIVYQRGESYECYCI